jgi:hypothetical protein
MEGGAEGGAPPVPEGMGEAAGPGRPKTGTQYGQDSHPRGRDPLGNDERYHASRHSLEKKRTPQKKSPLSLEALKYGLDKMPRPTLPAPAVLSEGIKLDVDKGTFLDEKIIEEHHIDDE